MQLIVVCCALIAATVAAPRPQEAKPQPQPVAYIIRHDSSVYPEGYQFAFETSDGTARQEQGTLKQVGETADQRALAVTGSYQYTAPDGLIHIVTFTADENGFKPVEQIQQARQARK